jgi:hypothetical protein
MNMALLILKIIGKVFGHFPKLILSLRYLKRFHRAINFESPQLFYDKVLWNSLYTDTSAWTLLADKYRVRSYVENKCGERVLTTLLGVYKKSEDIDFDALPNSFVIKTNNGCASNVIVPDKKRVNQADIRAKINYWLQFPYGELTGQKHYARIKPLIIVEEFLIQDGDPEKALIDYKFYCFKGMPTYCQIILEREKNTHIFYEMFYDMDWTPRPDLYSSTSNLKEASKPCCFEEMINLAKELSQGFDFVRVDLYNINGKPFFGEMTFMPAFKKNLTNKALFEFGQLMN